MTGTGAVRTFATASLLAIAAVAGAQLATGVVEAPSEREVLAAEAARTSAKRAGDPARLRTLVATDFIKINRVGRLLGPRQSVALAANPNYATQDVTLWLYAGYAVVAGRESDEGTRPGLVRFLRVWINDGARWQLWLDEGTTITSELEAAHLGDAAATSPDRVVARNPGMDANHATEVTDASDTETRDVRAAERRYHDAERIEDLTTLSRLRAPEFHFVDRLGKMVAFPTSAHQMVKMIEDDDHSVRVHRDVAIVIGSVLRSDLNNGATDRYRYATVWGRQPAGWRVVAEQRTPIG